MKELALMVTFRCSRKCPWCVSGLLKEGNDLKLDMDGEIIDKATNYAEERNVRKLHLYGGEPTIRLDIIEIARKVKAKGFELGVTTNYDFPQVIKQLDGIVDTITISNYNQLNFPDKNEFESELILATILYKGRFKNFDEFDKFIDKMSVNFDRLEFQTLTDVNEWTNERLADSFIRELFEEIGEERVYRGCKILIGAPNIVKVMPDGRLVETWRYSDNKGEDICVG